MRTLLPFARCSPPHAAAPALAQEAAPQGKVDLLSPELRADVLDADHLRHPRRSCSPSSPSGRSRARSRRARRRSRTRSTSAKRDREEAARLLAEHRAALDASRGEAQKLIADARAAAERVRAELIEQAHAEQTSMLERARQEIESREGERDRQLRREAVDLAIAGASRVIEQEPRPGGEPPARRELPRERDAGRREASR